jgi:hypothetical protein
MSVTFGNKGFGRLGIYLYKLLRRNIRFEKQIRELSVRVLVPKKPELYTQRNSSTRFV